MKTPMLRFLPTEIICSYCAAKIYGVFNPYLTTDEPLSRVRKRTEHCRVAKTLSVACPHTLIV